MFYGSCASFASTFLGVREGNAPLSTFTPLPLSPLLYSVWAAQVAWHGPAKHFRGFHNFHFCHHKRLAVEREEGRKGLGCRTIKAENLLRVLHPSAVKKSSKLLAFGAERSQQHVLPCGPGKSCVDCLWAGGKDILRMGTKAPDEGLWVRCGLATPTACQGRGGGGGVPPPLVHRSNDCRWGRGGRRHTSLPVLPCVMPDWATDGKGRVPRCRPPQALSGRRRGPVRCTRCLVAVPQGSASPNPRLRPSHAAEGCSACPRAVTRGCVK